MNLEKKEAQEKEHLQQRKLKLFSVLGLLIFQEAFD